MNNKEIQYHKLKEILNTTELLLEDIVEPEEGEEPEIAKSSPPRNPETDYEDKKSAVMNLAKSTLDAEERSDAFIKNGYKLLDSAKKAGEDAQFKVKELVIDLTKLSNELKEIRGMDDEKVTVDRIRKVLRYVKTAMSNANKTIKELNQKRERLEEEIDWEAYEKELADLEEKYGLDQLDDIEDEIAEQHAKAKDNAREIEKENKEIIRSFRALLGQLYAIPEEVAEIAKVHMKAYGAVASISNKGTQYNMKKKGILKILNDPDLYEELGEFIDINEDVKDRVQMVNSKIPDIGTYFAELNLEVNQQIEEIEELQSEFEKESKKKNEQFVSKIINKTQKIFLRSIFKFYNILGRETNDLFNKVKETIRPIVDSFRTLDENLDQRMKGANKNYLKVKRELKELDVDLISKAEQNLD